MSKEEIESNLLEIDFLEKRYFPQGIDELNFSIPGQKKPVVRKIDYSENIDGNKKSRLVQFDCSEGSFCGKKLRIAAVQLKYNGYGENSVVKITADEAYHRKVMAVLEAVKKEDADILVFPEFSIPFDYLEEIRKYADENGVVVVAGSHYVIEENLGKYGKLFSREFGESDLRKNISPVMIPDSKIVHNEKMFGAREERKLFSTEGMKAGKMNHIFKFHDKLNVGVMICYEFMNSELRQRLVRACDVIIVPQTNPKPEKFYKIANYEIDIPISGGNRAFIMANGIFTIEDGKKILGGHTGIVLTLDKHSNEMQNEGIMAPVDDNKTMEQFVLLMSINTDYFVSWDTQNAQEPITTECIHIFEENEILNNPKGDGKEFLKLLDEIERAEERDELKEALRKEENGELIKAFSPLMHKHTQDLNELTVEEMKKKCCSILIPAQQN